MPPKLHSGARLRSSRFRALRFAPTVCLGLLVFTPRANGLDLREAVVFAPVGNSKAERSSVRMLIEEVETRTRIRWAQTSDWPATNAIVISVGNRKALREIAGALASAGTSDGPAVGSEEFELLLQRDADRTQLLVAGNDARGVLFGVGRLLRELHMESGRVSVDDHLHIASAPKYPLRGHQLGYRPKTHSYDAWDLPVWEQYYRDLIVFGCNAVELIPPRSDDDADSPHFPRPPMEMMTGMSKLADDYGLDVWIWYPAMDPDYANPATIERAVKEWAEVFAKLPRIDAVFVPGGDPGHTQPKHLITLLAKQTESLHRFHPKAQMWVSPQGFTQTWMDEFIEILRRKQPAWLDGIVFGPQVRLALPKLRVAVPARYPIRHYPDITHSRQCQFPVEEWDTAFAVTEARECINPRPEAQAAIFRKLQPDTIGFITYSEGCNDDVNKAVWSALGWDPAADVTEILRQYSRYFIGEPMAQEFAAGLLALERNWRGPLLTNTSVDATLTHFQTLEKSASPALLRNWRFQQALFRAYYDAYVRHRLIAETELETLAMDPLRTAGATGSLAAMDAAEEILARATNLPVRADLKMRVHELAAALFQSISMQLSVEKYHAIAVDRGASLDTLDYPLNNAPWLKERFAAIRQLTSETERLAALDEILNWTNPGPGGFYDDLGRVGQQPHLLPGLSFAEDPSRMASARVDFEEDLVVDSPDETAGGARRMSWMDHAESLYDAPLRMRYTSLDPQAHYKLRVVYGGDNPKRKIRLLANDGIEIHSYREHPVPFRRLEFEVPPAATAKGELNLTWFGELGQGGNGRHCQVSEVWLIRESAAAPK